jgi:hypothetical protein
MSAFIKASHTHNNSHDIKLLSLAKINSIKDCKARNYSVGLRGQKLITHYPMIRIHKINKASLLLALYILFFLPLATPAAVIVYDRITTPGTPVYLKVLTKGTFFAAGGERITFYLNAQQIGKTLTGGDGYGYLKVAPEQRGMQEIEVRTENDKGKGHLLVLDRDEKVVVIEIEGALKTSLYSENIRAESRKAVTALSRSYKIIYLTRFLGFIISKTWLQNEKLPVSPVVRWQGTDTLADLKETGVYLWAFIGSAALVSTSSEYFEKNYTFEETETGTKLENWDEIEKLLLDKKIK